MVLGGFYSVLGEKERERDSINILAREYVFTICYVVFEMCTLRNIYQVVDTLDSLRYSHFTFTRYSTHISVGHTVRLIIGSLRIPAMRSKNTEC